MRQPGPQSKFPRLGKVTTPWGGKTTQESFHPGVDIAGRKGTPIKAPVSGKVIAARTGGRQGDNNFGNTLEIQAPNGDVHQMHHLSGVGARPGQIVKQGMPVATMGDTGATYSPSGGDATNLDYRIVNAFKKRYKNPTPYINKL